MRVARYVYLFAITFAFMYAIVNQKYFTYTYIYLCVNILAEMI